ncbi:uncharacterized protein NEMAJ01_0355 [Nematocida major]|uniref:uncharacterized protein n=1 Tax=Nematocida major TaxID=1912982 RepID=UPI0020087061|nr:uncharacterized protein NEMAJ01_0355 [Nematocida major]KAH9385459.1 hypothetical protein NEMAJ01_0355 [Nematocida major]
MQVGDNSIIVLPFEVVLERDTKRGEITLRNVTTRDYAFKIKTTHPTSYKVKPSIGMLPGGAEQIVCIEMHTKQESPVLKDHKFLLQFAESMQILTEKSLKHIFQVKGVRTVEQRLDVRYSDALLGRTLDMPQRIGENFLAWLAGLFVFYGICTLVKKLLFGD